LYEVAVVSSATMHRREQKEMHGIYTKIRMG
jgi:hypothetical protein